MKVISSLLYLIAEKNWSYSLSTILLYQMSAFFPIPIRNQKLYRMNKWFMEIHCKIQVLTFLKRTLAPAQSSSNRFAQLYFIALPGKGCRPQSFWRTFSFRTCVWFCRSVIENRMEFGRSFFWKLPMTSPFCLQFARIFFTGATRRILLDLLN